MKFRNYITLSVILHLILFLLFLFIPEKEKKEQEPFFVSLEELPTPQKPAPKVVPKPAPRPSPKKVSKKIAPPEKEKKAAKKPPELTPKQTIPEQENVLPNSIQGVLNKPKKTEPEKKEIAPKEKNTPEKSEKKQEGSQLAQKKKQRVPVEKKTEPKKLEPPKRQIALKPPVEKKIQSKPEPPKKQIVQKPPAEKKETSKPESQKKNQSLSDSTVAGKAKSLETKPKPSQNTGKGEASQKTKHINLAQLYDKDTIKEVAVKSSDSKKGASNKKGKDGVVTFDTTEFHLVGYMPRLRQRIESIWRYPPAAARSGLYGELYISFTILKDGRLSKVELIRTSGYKSLDDAAIQALKDGQPYWPLPKSWPHENLKITGRFVYVARGKYYLR